MPIRVNMKDESANADNKSTKKANFNEKVRCPWRMEIKLNWALKPTLKAESYCKARLIQTELTIW